MFVQSKASKARHCKTVVQHRVAVSWLNVHHNQLERSADGPMMRSKHSKTRPVSCGVSILQVLLFFPGLELQLWESQDSWSVFLKEEGIGQLALVFVTGSIDGQCKSPFPKEQAQQPTTFISPVLPHFIMSKAFLQHQFALSFLSHHSITYLVPTTVPSIVVFVLPGGPS